LRLCDFCALWRLFLCLAGIKANQTESSLPWDKDEL